MAPVTLLYRCVCGTNAPVSSAGTAHCPSCGRDHRVRPEGRAAETVLLVEPGHEIQGGAKEDAAASSPASRHGDPGTDAAAGPSAVVSAGLPAAASAPAESRGLVGQTIDHYEVLELFGRGGMGTVYRALDRSLERYVALKVLDSDEARRNESLVQAFIHEARAQARVNHPGIATIHYIGRFQDMTYFAMEMLSGPDLEGRLRLGPLPFAEVVAIGVQVVQALRDAEDRGVVHRDIKPGNLILTQSGRVKITDFGLSKTEKGGLQITGTHQIAGTPYYMAPEQARGETTDARADIYSLGATLYHLAYGRPPFEGETFMAVIAKHLGEPVRFPEAPPRDVPPGFPAIVSKMMAKRPDDRFRGYDDLEQALLALRPEALHVAPLLQRATAMAIDYAVLIVILGALLALLSRVLDFQDPRQARIQAITGFGLAALAAIAEQTWWRASLGKRFGKLRIARLDGRTPSRSLLAVRAFFQYLPLAAVAASQIPGMLGSESLRTAWVVLAATGFLAVDLLWALINRRRRTLHDFICGTWVLDRL